MSFQRNLDKRLVKSGKAYVRDSGRVHTVFGICTFNERAGHPVAELLWEGIVIENLLQVALERTRASVYRSAAGAEIDIVCEVPGHGLRTIEIRLSFTG